MSQEDKLKARFLERPPRNDITKDEVIKFLSHYDYVVARDNGSHIIFSPKDKNSGKNHITIPTQSGRFVKAYYIKVIGQALKLR